MGLTQGEFAKQAGVTLRTVQNWEGNGTVPESKRDMLQRFKEQGQTYVAEGAINQQGGNNTCLPSSALDKALAEIAEMRKALTAHLAASQAQTERLLAIIEKMSEK